MHVGIDLTPLLPIQTGVDTFIREIVPALVALDPDMRFTLFANREDRALFEDRFGGNVALKGWCTRGRAVRGAFQQAVLPAACRALGIDVLHSPSFLLPLVRGGARHLLTVHDMTFFTMPTLHLPFHQTGAFRRAVTISAHRADLIHVPSDDTKEALLEHWPGIAPERVRVTPFGVTRDFRPLEDGDDVERHRHRLGLPERYVLFVGTIEPRKNLAQLIAAFTTLGDRGVSLVVAGRLGWGYQGVLGALERLEREGRAKRLGFVLQEDLPWVYRAATLFVYPSLYEGFGFPPLEALASGVPVIASRGSAHDDNLAGAAELVAPDDAEALAAAMKALLAESSDARRSRVERGLARARDFSWRRTAELVHACYRDLVPSAR